MAKKGRGERRCVVEGCERAVRPGRPVCLRHSRSREGKAAAAAARGLARVMADEAQRTASAADRVAAMEAEVERRLARGDYAGLLDGRTREVMGQAATLNGLAEEFGVGRKVLMRLLAEEEDLGKLALGVSRVISANARVARARHAIGEREGHGLTDAIVDFLAHMDGEQLEGAWLEVAEERRRG